MEGREGSEEQYRIQENREGGIGTENGAYGPFARDEGTYMDNYAAPLLSS